jgi:WhiB family redox-sensing transcriptional regulator
VAVNSVEARPDEQDAPGWDDGGWREHAACQGEDPELFFPVGETGPALEQIAEAKQLCAECPVRQECLRFAIDTRQDYGIWGGLTREERRKVRRREQRAARRPAAADARDERLAG